MVFNATFNNISVISWRSVLFMHLHVYRHRYLDAPDRDWKQKHNCPTNLKTEYIIQF
jgi:hypothetical protein